MLFQLSGFESYSSSAQLTLEELGCYGDVILDVIEFRSMAGDLLVEFPTEVLDVTVPIKHSAYCDEHELSEKLQLLSTIYRPISFL